MQNISAGTDQNRSFASRLMNAAHQKHIPLSALLHVSGRCSQRPHLCGSFFWVQTQADILIFLHRLISFMNIAVQSRIISAESVSTSSCQLKGNGATKTNVSSFRLEERLMFLCLFPPNKSQLEKQLISPTAWIKHTSQRFQTTAQLLNDPYLRLTDKMSHYVKSVPKILICGLIRQVSKAKVAPG